MFVANHVSWWDGFLVRAVQRRLRPGAPLFTVMAADQAARFPMLTRMGVLPLDASSIASARDLWRTLARLRAEHREALAVSYFAQGRIWPSTRRPLGFRSGAGKAADVLAPVAIVPVALHIEPLAGVLPHAFAVAGAPIVHREGAMDPAVLERAVERELDWLRGHLERTGEDAVRDWPGAPAPRRDATEGATTARSLRRPDPRACP